MRCAGAAWGLGWVAASEEPGLPLGGGRTVWLGWGCLWGTGAVLRRVPGPTLLLLPSPLACPGGASHPCSDHGVCMDGMSGSGQCRCHSGFAGTACELCAPGAFGPHCQGGLSCSLPCPNPPPLVHVPTPSSCLSLSAACRCASHGHCDEGLGGSGSCFCDEGWTGPLCEVQLGE